MTLMASWGQTRAAQQDGGDALAGGGITASWSQWYLHGAEVGCIIHTGQAAALPSQVGVVLAVLVELQLLWSGDKEAAQP